MKELKFKLKNGTTKTMVFDEFVRWSCLIEAMETVSEKLDNDKVKESDESWIKPLAFNKYIEERFHSMRHDLSVEAMMGNI